MDFTPFPKIGRLFRDIVITEKIDGTNACVIIEEGIYHDFEPGLIATVLVDGQWYSVGAQSRNKLIWPGKSTDNAGFALWVRSNAELLVAALGKGRHFGEWWGSGIQRNYGLDHKRFSLFNVGRYDVRDFRAVARNLRLDVVPTLWSGPFSEDAIVGALETLRHGGSLAAPTFKRPEGIVVFHSSTGTLFKVTLENDEKPKGQA